MTHTDKKYPPEAIANSILWLADEEGRPVTPMQLIKLVYFVYGWVLALLDRKLFDDPIEAWQHGPVVPRIYYQFQKFGGDPITAFAVTPELDAETGAVIKKRYPVVDPEDKEVLAIIQAVWSAYKKRDGWGLSAITHEEDSAWRKAYQEGKYTRLDDAEIKARSLEGIDKYYGQAK